MIFSLITNKIMKTDYSIFNNYYSSSKIPVTIIENGKIIFSVPQLEKSPFSPSFIDICIMDFMTRNITSKEALIYALQPGYFLGISKLNENTYLFAGPVIPYHFSLSELHQYIQPPLYRDNQKGMLHLLSSSIPVSLVDFTNSFLVSIFLLVQEKKELKQINFETIRRLCSNIHPSLSEYILEVKEGNGFHAPEKLEMQLAKAIEEGNIAVVEQLFSSRSPGRQGTLSLNEERQIRYMFVTASSATARAAMRGGLDYETACSMADIYCQKMDMMTDIQQIKLFQLQMFRDFCNAVADSKSNHFSKNTKECCDYIRKHSHENISLTDLSELCNLSPRRLSAQFSRETGLSIVDYIHQIKLKEAASLLQYSNYSITEISNYLGYSTQSYFTARFKEYYGLTPLQFRKKH